MAQRARYPAISLPEAVERLEKIYEREGPNAMSSEVAVQHMGYGGLNGASLGVLAALKKYGLLDGRAEDIRVSHAGVIIVSDKHAEDQQERAESLRAALVNDPLFKELFERFGTKTTEINVISYLQKRGFRPSAAKNAAKSFIESTAFVEDEAGSYNESQTKDVGAPQMPHGTGQPTDSPAAARDKPFEKYSNFQEAPIVISGVPEWPVIRLPKPFSAKNWEDMLKILAAMRDGLITEQSSEQSDGSGEKGKANEEHTD